MPSRLRLRLILLLTAFLTGCSLHCSDQDIAQERLDRATPPLDGSLTVMQSFVCRRDGLYEMELLPAVYESPGHGLLQFTLLRPTMPGSERLTLSVDASSVRHNEPLRLTFAPQPDSGTTAYQLQIAGSPGVQVGFWYSSANAYAQGSLWLDGEDTKGDLRLITRHQSDPIQLLRGVAETIGRLVEGQTPKRSWLVALPAVLLLPGFALWHGLGLAGRDPLLNLTNVVALSLAAAPVALLWSTVVGLRWNSGACVLAYVVLALICTARLLRTRLRDLSPWLARSNRELVLAMSALLGTSLAVRFVQIRDLVLPAWVDSPQHALITELVLKLGHVPTSYEPLVPAPFFVYHFGFHAVLAAFHWLSGISVPQAMLFFGQILNALCAIMVYPFALRLTGQRVAAVVAVLLAGLVSHMPAYYVSWGRYTQLTGLVLLPAATAGAIKWLEGERRNLRLLPIVALLWSGLAVAHVRVAFFGLCFMAVYVLSETVASWRGTAAPAVGELWKRSAFLALLVVAMVAPWIAQVIGGTMAALRATGATLSGNPAYNTIPQALLFAPHNRELMLLAAGGAAWGLVRRRHPTIWLLAWCAVVAFLLNLGAMGLPATNLLNNASAIIALFLPLSVLGGQASEAVWTQGVRVVSVWDRSRSWRHGTKLYRAAAAVTVGVVALGGAWGMASIVNPVTVLATAEDVQAMAWIRQNTPEDAVFLINTRHWQLGTYVGTDGGYWIRRLTGRQALLPELPYVYGSSESVQHITALAQAVSQAESGSDPALRELISEEEVDYIYIGARGGPMTPLMFLGNPDYRTAYNSGPVWIFETRRPTKTGQPSGTRATPPTNQGSRSVLLLFRDLQRLVELDHQSRLAPSRVVLMDDTLLCCLVQGADCPGDAPLSLIQFSCLNQSPRPLDVGPSFGSNLSVALSPLFRLA